MPKAWLLLSSLWFVIVSPSELLAQSFSLDSQHGFRYQTDQRNFDLRLGGRMHLDGGIFENDQGQMEDDWLWRRLRLSLRMDVYKDWRFSLQYDLEDEEERYNSLWLRYRGLSRINITLGQFEEPFGLEQSTSSNAITFMERSLPIELTPGTNVGIEFSRYENIWTQELGFFWETYIEDNKPLDVSEGKGLSGRLTRLLSKNELGLVHMGISASLRWPDDRDRIRFRSRPETRLTDVRLINTGRIRQVERYLMTGLEGALVYKNLSLQSEYMYTRVDFQRGYGEDESVHGAYIYFSWLLTGEQRRYKNGVFRDLRIKGKPAWELGLRRSYLDLSGNELNGGREDDITLGLNAYISDVVRIMFNYIWVDSDAIAGDIDPRIMQMRLQVAI